MAVEKIILNTYGADLAMVMVKEEINIQKFTPICLPKIGIKLILNIFLYLPLHRRRSCQQFYGCCGWFQYP